MTATDRFATRPPAQVRRYSRADAPLVTLRCDRAARGRLIEEGPEQSVVRWNNGNENVVCNDWIERVDDGGEGPGPSPLAAAAKTSPSDQKAPERAPASAEPAVPKRKPPPDDLGAKVAEHCDDLEALKRFATANACWDDKYAQLPNPGLVRMNVVNRLRAKVRKGHEIKWK